ncbi:hypothetical protein ACXET9_09355 [Brachybacterium sp. DNPG3]
MPNAEAAADLELLRREAEPEPVSTLVLLEILFCDYERDPEVLDRYFARFEHSLASLRAQEVPEGVELLVTVQMSSDKQPWIGRTAELLRKPVFSPRTRFRLYQYEHPADGYPGGDDSRVDWVKSPNKHSPYRENLFMESHAGLQVERYRRIIRVGLDDDDVWMPWQTENICRIAELARLSPEVTHEGVLAIGMLDTLVAYADDDGFSVDSVRLKRSLTGDKFNVIDNPESLESIAIFHATAVPERVDMESHERLLRIGAGLYGAGGYVPGFAYMRWGQNLSRQGKEYLELKRFGGFRAASASEVFQRRPSDVARDEGRIWVSLPERSEAFAVEARRVGNSIEVDSNLSKQPGASWKVCYYLMNDGKRVDARWYSTESSTIFESAPSGSSVRAFLRGSDGVIAARAESEKL